MLQHFQMKLNLQALHPQVATSKTTSTQNVCALSQISHVAMYVYLSRVNFINMRSWLHWNLSEMDNLLLRFDRYIFFFNPHESHLSLSISSTTVNLYL